MNTHQVLLIISIVLFAVAGLVAEWPTGWPRISLGWFGGAFLAASFLFLA